MGLCIPHQALLAPKPFAPTCRGQLPAFLACHLCALSPPPKMAGRSTADKNSACQWRNLHSCCPASGPLHQSLHSKRVMFSGDHTDPGSLAPGDAEMLLLPQCGTGTHTKRAMFSEEADLLGMQTSRYCRRNARFEVWVYSHKCRESSMETHFCFGEPSEIWKTRKQCIFLQSWGQFCCKQLEFNLREAVDQLIRLLRRLQLQDTLYSHSTWCYHSSKPCTLSPKPYILDPSPEPYLLNPVSLDPNCRGLCFLSPNDQNCLAVVSCFLM